MSTSSKGKEDPADAGSEERQQFQKTMEIMFAQMSHMMQILDARDAEIVRLRGAVPAPDPTHDRNDGAPQVSRVSHHEISSQIPEFSNQPEDMLNIKMWLRRVEDLKTLYALSDDTVRILATNRLAGNAKRWYQAQEDICMQPWESVKARLSAMFDDIEDEGTLVDKVRARKWQRGERLEEYYIDKLSLAKRAKMSDSETISHMIRGIDNFAIRTQLLMARHATLDSLYRSLKLIAPEIRSINKDRNNTKPTLRCDVCRKEGHSTDRCRNAPQNREIKKTLICHKCNAAGHIARFCTTTAASTPDSPQRGAVMTVDVGSRSKYQKTVLVCGRYCEALIDTGSKLNLLKEGLLPQLEGEAHLEPRTLRGFNNSKFDAHHVVEFDAHLDNCTYRIQATLVPSNAMDSDLLLGQQFLDTVTWCVTKEAVIFNKVEPPDSSYNGEVSSIMSIHVEPSELECEMGTQLSASQRMWILQEIAESLAMEGNKTNKPPETDTKMVIELTDGPPVRATPRRLAHYERQIVDDIVADWIKQGVIRPSHSEYSSPIVLMKKKTGGHRLCIDYRALNKRTIRDSFPLPHIDDLMSNLGHAAYFTLIDLKNGFFHVEVDENSRKYTSFVVPNGQYEFTRMPFGLTNAPSVFQRYIFTIFQDLIQKGLVQAYMDDLLIATATIEENIEIIRLVMNRIKQYQLKIRVDKCHFVVTELEYLGHRLSRFEIRPGTEKVRAVRCFPIPKDKKQLRGFLGLTGYFRKFIRNYSLIAKPLTDMLKEDRPFTLETEQIRAITTLKEALTNEPVLKIYDPKREIEVHTDASSHGYGAILLQRHDDGKYHPVYYFSSKTTDAESRYHSFELEVLAIVKALERFRIYVLGKRFKLVTDCHALKQTLEKKDVHPRICRWSIALQDYDYVIEHRNADRMTHVDALSRQFQVQVLDEMPVEDEIQIAQDLDEELRLIKAKVLAKESAVNDFVVINGKLYRKSGNAFLFVVPRKMRHDVVMRTHEAIAHLGRDKTLEQLRGRYYFRNMRKYVEKCLAGCLRCLQYNHKTRNNEGFLHSIDKGDQPWDTLHIDHVGPLLKSTHGHRYIFEIIDGFSKFIFLEPTKTTASAEAIKILRALFRTFGPPRRIIADRGTAFTSNDFVQFCEDEHIALTHIAVQTPRANGQMERYNRTIMPALCKLSETAETWHRVLGRIQIALNSTIQRSTGKAPSEIFFGYSLRNKSIINLSELQESEIAADQFVQTRLETRKQAKESIERSQQAGKQRYDSTRVAHRQYNEGDRVLIARTGQPVGGSAKMTPKFTGPYYVAKVLPHDRYLITDVPGYQVTQKPFRSVLPPERLKAWTRYTDNDDDPPDSDSDCTQSNADPPGSVQTSESEDDSVPEPVALTATSRRRGRPPGRTRARGRGRPPVRRGRL